MKTMRVSRILILIANVIKSLLMTREIDICIVILKYTYGSSFPAPKQRWLGFVPVLELLPELVLLVFLWIAFVKVKNPQKKGWMIFVLVVGILLAVLSLIKYYNSPVELISSVGVALLYILSFALKPDITKNKTKEIAIDL